MERKWLACEAVWSGVWDVSLDAASDGWDAAEFAFVAGCGGSGDEGVVGV